MICSNVGTGFPGISPGSASGTACSPGSGSHDTLGSPDGNRLIGKLNSLHKSYTILWMNNDIKVQLKKNIYKRHFSRFHRYNWNIEIVESLNEIIPLIFPNYTTFLIGNVNLFWFLIGLCL